MKKTRAAIRRTGVAATAVLIVAFTAIGLVAPGGTASGQTDPYATSTTPTTAAATTTTSPQATTTTSPQATSTTSPQATTTTSPGGVTCRITIEIDIGRGRSGIRVRVRARCFPPGAEVTFTFNGRSVGQAISAPGGGTAAGLPAPLAAVLPNALLRAVQPQTAAEPVADLFFDIPAVSPGTYPVCAFSDGIAPVCTSFQVTSVGVQGTRRGLTDGALPRSLPTSGQALLAYAGIGLAAVAIGWGLRTSSRRRHSV